MMLVALPQININANPFGNLFRVDLLMVHITKFVLIDQKLAKHFFKQTLTQLRVYIGIQLSTLRHYNIPRSIGIFLSSVNILMRTAIFRKRGEPLANLHNCVRVKVKHNKQPSYPSYHCLSLQIIASVTTTP